MTPRSALEMQSFDVMSGPIAERFGALELAGGELWLGKPRTRFRPGIRLNAECLSQWGAPGPRDTPWESLSDLMVLVGEPEERGRAGRMFERAENALDWISLATGMSARWYKEQNGGIRLDWTGGSGERGWAASVPNWPAPLTDTEQHAARALPAGLLGSASVRDLIRSPDQTGELLGRFASATSRGDVDRILDQYRRGAP